MDEKNKYLLKGDISGIQEFIFNVQSKGAAKTLKARSYYVQILSKLAYDFVLLNLATSKEFYYGGGTFFIEFEAENEAEANKNVENVRSTLYDSQKEEDLLFHLSFVEIKGNGFWQSLRSVSNREKLQMLSTDLEFFKPFDRVKEINDGRFPQVESWIQKASGINDESNLFEVLTEVMVKQKTILVKLLGAEFTAHDAQFKESLINKLSFWENYGELEAYRKYRNDNIALYSGDDKCENKNIIDFDALGDFAAHRTGTNKIGILKLDVDNLGELFGSADIVLVKNYSDIFSKFFNETIFTALYDSKDFRLGGEVIEKYRSNVYTIFSGGDDCFIIGSWDAILSFAGDLHDLFIKDEVTTQLVSI